MENKLSKKGRLSALFKATVLSGLGIFSSAGAEELAQTRHTQTLSGIETEANAASRALGLNREIIVIDRDASFMQDLEDMRSFSSRIKSDILRAGFSVGYEQSSDIEDGFGREWNYYPLAQDPRATVLPAKEVGEDACTVVPETMDVSAQTLSRGFLGEDITAQPKAKDVGQNLFLHITYHEVWHCLDGKFLPHQQAEYKNREKDPAAAAVLRHKVEMFAEVGATLTMAQKGETDISRLRADMRAYRSWKAGWSFVKGPDKYSKKYDPEYYTGAYYYLTPGTDAALAHISSIGLDKLKSYSAADINRIAVEIVETSALDRRQVVTLGKFFEGGDVYIASLRASQNAEDKKDLAFMEKYLARARLAESRSIDPAPEALKRPPLPENGYKFWETLPETLRQEVSAEFERRLRETNSPKQALAEMFDVHRKVLHETADPVVIKREEDFLAALRAMLDGGIARQKALPFKASLTP